MHIVKSNPDGKDITRIACLCLNLEKGVKHYDFDAKPIAVGPNDRIQYAHYADIKSGATIYRIVPSSGTIYISPTANIATFAQNLKREILNKELEMNNPFRPEAGLNEYRAVEQDSLTVTMIQPGAKLTSVDDEHKENIARHIITPDFYNSKTDNHANGPYPWARSTFTWFIRSISGELFMPFDGREAAKKIASLLVGVFYDIDNICNLEHGTTVTQFNKDHLYAEKQVIKMAPVHIITNATDNTRLLDYECNPRWREIDNNIHDLPQGYDNLGYVKHNEADIHPVTLTGGIKSTTCCQRCGNDLFGKVFALSRPKNNDQDRKQHLYCALCVYGMSPNSNVILSYNSVNLMNFPTTIQDMINKGNYTAEVKDILMRFLNAKLHAIVYNGKNVYYWSLGNNMYAFNNATQFYTTPICRLPRFKNARIVPVVVYRD